MVPTCTPQQFGSPSYAMLRMKTKVILLVHVLVAVLILQGKEFSLAEAKKKLHITDDLDDVVDDEEDDAWKEWGKPKSKNPPAFDPPPDITDIDPSQIQTEMLKRHFGPSIGFVKLRLDVPRTKLVEPCCPPKEGLVLCALLPTTGAGCEEVPKIAKKWTELLKTGSIDAKFMAVDVNTIMFTMEEGQATAECNFTSEAKQRWCRPRALCCVVEADAYTGEMKSLITLEVLRFVCFPILHAGWQILPDHLMKPISSDLHVLSLGTANR
eukprot:Gb_40949 [translate_table: standard]